MNWFCAAAINIYAVLLLDCAYVASSIYLYCLFVGGWKIYIIKKGFVRTDVDRLTFAQLINRPIANWEGRISSFRRLIWSTRQINCLLILSCFSAILPHSHCTTQRSESLKHFSLSSQRAPLHLKCLLLQTTHHNYSRAMCNENISQDFARGTKKFPSNTTFKDREHHKSLHKRGAKRR